MAHFHIEKVLTKTDEYEVALGYSELTGEKTLGVRWRIDSTWFPQTVGGSPSWFPMPKLTPDEINKYLALLL